MGGGLAPEGDGGTVGKALAVLDLVAARGRPVRFVDLVAESPYPKATLYRLLQTLAGQGMLSHDPERQTYALGLRLVRLAHAAWAQASLAPIAARALDALSAATGETVHLAQLDHAQVLYVDKRVPARPVEMYSAAGKVGPAYCTGVGKAMLAYLPEAQRAAAVAQQSFYPFTPATLVSPQALLAELARIRAEGVAYDREEHEPGIHCVAAPILSRAGRLLGALSVTSTTERRRPEEMAALVPQVQRTAAEIAAEAEAWRFPEPRAEHREESPCRA